MRVKKKAHFLISNVWASFFSFFLGELRLRRSFRDGDHSEDMSGGYCTTVNHDRSVFHDTGTVKRLVFERGLRSTGFGDGNQRIDRNRVTVVVLRYADVQGIRAFVRIQRNGAERCVRYVYLRGTATVVSASFLSENERNVNCIAKRILVLVGWLYSCGLSFRESGQSQTTVSGNLLSCSGQKVLNNGAETSKSAVSSAFFRCVGEYG